MSTHRPRLSVFNTKSNCLIPSLSNNLFKQLLLFYSTPIPEERANLDSVEDVASNTAKTYSKCVLTALQGPSPILITTGSNNRPALTATTKQHAGSLPMYLKSTESGHAYIVRLPESVTTWQRALDRALGVSFHAQMH
jgi:hypothetical protein